MISSILCITSQVEHIKKCNSIDSEGKSVKKCQSSELFSNVFLHVTLVLPCGEKMFSA